MTDLTTQRLLWAKTNAAGRPHSLPGHLLDAAAVAELIWDRYLSAAAQRAIDEVVGGNGRDLLRMIAGLHDVGKATPAFQSQAIPLQIAEIDAAWGQLDLPHIEPDVSYRDWYHGPAGAVILAGYLTRAQLPDLRWILPIVEGHHGYFGRVPNRPPRHHRKAHGEAGWDAVQQGLIDGILDELGIYPTNWAVTVPSRGLQLAIAGLVVMADWISSSDLFPGLGLNPVSIEAARQRASHAWDVLAINRGWHDLGAVDASFFTGRFGFPPRPLQEAMVDVVTGMPDAGLILVEAPMGEGKTEAAEAAVELLARESGYGGYLFCMPTQGTTDAMYHRVARWSDEVDAQLPPVLLHGKSALNEEWVERSKAVTFTEVFDGDEFGLHDEYGLSRHQEEVQAPSAWLLGRHRGLLSPGVVATVDQALWAGTRTRFVALRHAGLLGKVVVIDEVHAYDAYMGVFLHELLRWCGRMGTPVILMSATLPPSVRDGLVAAWAQGAGRTANLSTELSGYPLVLAMSRAGERVQAVSQFRPDLRVQVEVPGVGVDDVGGIVDLADTLTVGGGNALVVLNTVARAQQTWRGLRERNVPALLIHGRFTAYERARRTQEALDALGAAGKRPQRLVVVATQIAEQSFDVDADVLISDIAPMDLLLQRIGRLHRHEANKARRAGGLSEPRVFVTGVEFDARGVPHWHRDFGFIYRQWALLSTAALIREPETVWRVPGQVPELVSNAYQEEWHGPIEWRDAVEQARAEEEAEIASRTSIASTFRLDADPETTKTDLAGLHDRASSASEEQQAMVRDGIDTVEVVLLRLAGGEYVSMRGRRLGDHAQRAADPELARELLGDTVRLRAQHAKHLDPFTEWTDKPLLSRMPVLVLPESGVIQLGKYSVEYDDDLGLVITR